MRVLEEIERHMRGIHRDIRLLSRSLRRSDEMLDPRYNRSASPYRVAPDAHEPPPPPIVEPPPDEYLSCGCLASLARPHHPRCSGRHSLHRGHYWSREEIAEGWHRQPNVGAGRLWTTMGEGAVSFSSQGVCRCAWCLIWRMQ